MQVVCNMHMHILRFYFLGQISPVGGMGVHNVILNLLCTYNCIFRQKISFDKAIKQNSIDYKQHHTSNCQRSSIQRGQSMSISQSHWNKHCKRSKSEDDVCGDIDDAVDFVQCGVSGNFIHEEQLSTMKKDTIDFSYDGENCITCITLVVNETGSKETSL